MSTILAHAGSAIECVDEPGKGYLREICEIVDAVSGEDMGFGVGVRVGGFGLRYTYEKDEAPRDAPEPIMCPACVRREGKETCPWCGSIDIEEPGFDYNRYCNSCRKPVNH